MRSPGDRGPGARVVLVVDEYHLEIRRDLELMGRWYLADVEVVRDVAEKFTLFLGEDEMEFLADDALKFAYEGVTGMQEGWLTAQKGKRRHRRAADQAARKKDETPAEVIARPLGQDETRRQTPARPAAPTSELGRKLAALAAAEGADSGSPVPDSMAWTDSVARLPDKPRKKTAPAAKKKAPEVPVLDEASPDRALDDEAPVQPTLADRRRGIVAARGQEKDKKPAADARPARSNGRAARTGSRDDLKIPASPPRTGPPGMEPLGIDPPGILPIPGDLPIAVEGKPEPGSEPLVAGRRPRRSTRHEPEPARATTRLEVVIEHLELPIVAPLIEIPDGRSESVSAVPGDVRFALDGHHPAETTTGLLSKLRRHSKPPNGHIHKYRESGSSVGLVRRVCTECSHVSIGSDD